jgi:di/tricarboxylate transporter
MIGFESWYTLILLVLMTIFLVTEIIEADVVIFTVLILLVLGNVISLEEAFQGFSNHGMLTIAFLFIVAAAIQKTNVFNKMGGFLLGKNGSIAKKLCRFLPPVSVFSAFFNNTPIVAMLIPVVKHWAKKHNIALSKFLIPLSYATIIGGTCTLIGTSTNLVVHGLMLENGLKGLSFFELTPVGISLTIVGLLWIILVGYKLLPDRKDPVVVIGENTREFVLVVKVENNYQHIGHTVEHAGLRHLKGLFLFQIQRGDKIISPAKPDETIMLGDRLFFNGLPETIMDLQKTPGLSLMKDAVFDLDNYDSDDLGTFEVVISPNSPLIGKNVRDSNFRSVYDAVIVAIHRSGERVRQKIGDIVMHSGDTLLIMARHTFIEHWYHSRDFYLVSRSVGVNSKPRWYSYLSVGVLLGMIAVMASGIVPVLTTVCVAAGILVLSRCITPHDARSSVDWKVLLIIASAFGISKALTNSGLAQFLAQGLLEVVGSIGILGMLAIIYLITWFYTEIITNNAAAALMVPIAIAMANQAAVDPRPFLIAVTIAASSSFATPIGYQTNLMVYGPGGYKFRDFLKIGIPTGLLVSFVAIMAIYFFYIK